MRSTLLLSAACVFALAGSANAATVAIVGGHIFTAGPQGEIASGTVVIKDGRIPPPSARTSRCRPVPR